MNTDIVEKLLRKVPPVRTPAGLLHNLQADIALPHPASRIPHPESLNPGGWFRRWMPALGFALWFLGCVVVFGIQASHIAELREENRILESAKIAATQQALAAEAANAAAAAQLEQLQKDLADVQRLRTETEQLRMELAELPKIRAENERLRVELNPALAAPVRTEPDFFAGQADRAYQTRCINNLKQVGLAARLWANNRPDSDVLPSSFDAMKAELNTDIITFCPSDGTTRYELLSPGASEREPQLVYTRCPIHRNVGLTDGRAQTLRENQKVVQRDGKWVIE